MWSRDSSAVIIIKCLTCALGLLEEAHLCQFAMLWNFFFAFLMFPATTRPSCRICSPLTNSWGGAEVQHKTWQVLDLVEHESIRGSHLWKTQRRLAGSFRGRERERVRQTEICRVVLRRRCSCTAPIQLLWQEVTPKHFPGCFVCYAAIISDIVFVNMFSDRYCSSAFPSWVCEGLACLPTCSSDASVCTKWEWRDIVRFLVGTVKELKFTRDNSHSSANDALPLCKT